MSEDRATPEWRDNWTATVASDVHTRDGIGWEFTHPATQELVWQVFREDGGPFPVFSAARGGEVLPPRAELAAMTTEAVADLLGGARLADEMGWRTRNIAGALLLASADVQSWEGEEWALESGADDEPLLWAKPDDPRTPYAWLRAKSGDSDSVIGIYQDDAHFGLCFIHSGESSQLPDTDEGSLRSRRDISLPSGRIDQVEVVYDTSIGEGPSGGVVTETLISAGDRSVLLIAAEAYGIDEWHLYDESVVVVHDPASADHLSWVPARKPWGVREQA